MRYQRGDILVAAAMEEWDSTPGALEWLVKGMTLALADAALAAQRVQWRPWQ